MAFSNASFILFIVLLILGGSILSFRGKAFVVFLLFGNFIFYFSKIDFRIGLIGIDLLACHFYISNFDFFKSRKRFFSFLAFKIGVFLLIKLSPLFLSHNLLMTGFSFYFLWSLGYIIDLRLKRADPISGLYFFTASTFFAIINSGPIVKLSEIIKQLKDHSKNFDSGVFLSGLLLVSLGLFKKAIAEIATFTLIGNRFAYELSPTYFAWIQMAAFAGKYYADFSGYSDIAIGCSRMIGIQIPQNFQTPFFAETFSDFWRRWHMSFNNWLREYIFEPFCFGIRLDSANRLQKIVLMGRLYIGVVLTGIIAGLWHGFSNCFLAWGLFVGVFICIESYVGHTGFRYKFIGQILTFYIVLHSFLFFRFESLSRVLIELRQLYVPQKNSNPAACLMYLFSLIVIVVLPHMLDSFMRATDDLKRFPYHAVALSLLLLALHYVLLGFTGVEFAYFRF